jgi:hypothetical protein
LQNCKDNIIGERFLFSKENSLNYYSLCTTSLNVNFSNCKLLARRFMSKTKEALAEKGSGNGKRESSVWWGHNLGLSGFGVTPSRTTL